MVRGAAPDAPLIAGRSRLGDDAQPVLQYLAIGVLLEELLQGRRARPRQAQDENGSRELRRPDLGIPLEVIDDLEATHQVAHDLVANELFAQRSQLGVVCVGLQQNREALFEVAKTPIFFEQFRVLLKIIEGYLPVFPSAYFHFNR